MNKKTMPFSDQYIKFKNPIYPAEVHKTCLKRILPENNIESSEDLFHWLTNHLPIAEWYFEGNRLFINSFSFLLQEFDQESFFLEMIKGHNFLKKTIFISFHSAPFFIKDFEFKTFLLLTASFDFETKMNHPQVYESLRLLTNTLTLGSRSLKAGRDSITNAISKIHNRFSSAQTSKIFYLQHAFEYLLSRHVDRIDADLFNELSCFLSFCSPLFFEAHSMRHLKRLIFSQYIMRRSVKRKAFTYPEKRHLEFRLFHTDLLSIFEKKRVLGIMVVLSFFDKYESFDEKHILLTIQRWIPKARLVQGSCYLYQNPQDPHICTIYLEIYKENSHFHLSELISLRKILASALKESIEKLTPALFTLRNEEQVMKNIIILNREIHSKESLPQIMIHFEKQQENELIFIVMVVYVYTNQQIESSLQNLVDIDVTLERQEIVGYLGDHPKKALVYRFKLNKSKDLLRNDFSVNIHLARGKVYESICRSVGEVRDYDGGLFLKQQELLSELKMCYLGQLDERKELLENFFYSISPIEKQATSPLWMLVRLFAMVLTSLRHPCKDKGSYLFNVQIQNGYFYIFISAEDISLKSKVIELLNSWGKQVVISTSFPIHDTIGIGLIIDAQDTIFCEQCREELHACLRLWRKERMKNRVLCLNVDQQRLTLDPRMLKDAVSKEVLPMLFEGLLRIGAEGKAEFALAKSVDISTCRKTYIFQLRDCKWSDGSEIKAYSFEYSWKKILSPDFVTPYVHYLYPIKNAYAAKNRKVPISNIGIKALDSKTLRIDLEYPFPYFLDLLTLPIFSPVNHLIDKVHPHWPSAEGEAYLCNGPFRLKKNQLGEAYIFEKNPFYWDAEHVFLHKIILTHTNLRTALKMFENGELDWLGYPMRIWDPLFENVQNENSERLHLLNRVYWTTFNTKTSPLSNKKLRQALALAINRQELVEIFPYAIPAFSPLPPNLSHFFHCGTPEGEISLALRLFKESLEELQLTKESFPVLRFLYRDSKNMQTLTENICAQWKNIFGINICIEPCKKSQLFQKITLGDYEIANISWLSWINNPLYTLYAFYAADDYLNFPNWENEEFRRTIEQAMHHDHDALRSKDLEFAESILIKEAPVIPLFAVKNCALKKKTLKIDLNNEFADFKKAIFSN